MKNIVFFDVGVHDKNMYFYMYLFPVFYFVLFCLMSRISLDKPQPSNNIYLFTSRKTKTKINP